MRNKLLAILLSLVPSAFVISLAAAAENAATVEATVRSMSSRSQELNLQTADGKELNLHIDRQSNLERDGAPIGADYPLQGVTVKVRYETQNGVKRLVSLSAESMNAEQMQGAIAEAADLAAKYSYEQRAQLQQRLQRVVNLSANRIAQMSFEASRSGTERRQLYLYEIQRLRNVHDLAMEQAASIHSATPGAWQDFRNQAGPALQLIGQGLQGFGK